MTPPRVSIADNDKIMPTIMHTITVISNVKTSSKAFITDTPRVALSPEIINAHNFDAIFHAVNSSNSGTNVITITMIANKPSPDLIIVIPPMTVSSTSLTYPPTTGIVVPNINFPARMATESDADDITDCIEVVAAKRVVISDSVQIIVFLTDASISLNISPEITDDMLKAKYADVNGVITDFAK